MLYSGQDIYLLPQDLRERLIKKIQGEDRTVGRAKDQLAILVSIARDALAMNVGSRCFEFAMVDLDPEEREDIKSNMWGILGEIVRCLDDDKRFCHWCHQWRFLCGHRKETK